LRAETHFVRRRVPLGNSRWYSHCKACRLLYQKAYAKRNPEKVRAASRKAYHRDPQKSLARSAEIRRTLKQAAFEHYGQVCACCSEADKAFLTIDHIVPPKSKSSYERKRLYGWLKSRKYPSGFQTLCWNCNMTKGIYGACPHKVPAVRALKEREEA